MPFYMNKKLVLAFVFAWGFGCSGKNLPEVPAPTKVAEEDLVSNAQVQLEKGTALLHKSEFVAAGLVFNSAIDLLRSFPGGVAADPQVFELYRDLVSLVEEVEQELALSGTEQLSKEEESEVNLINELANNETLDNLGVDARIESSDLPEIKYDIPIVLNQRVKSIIEMFQHRRNDWFQSALERSGYYSEMIRRVFQEEGVPQDLIYLAMVESAFKARAVSRAGARGLWQFISGTGRLYGLKQTFWVDDRFNPERATRAAARHLRDLYEDFGDWYLAFAAYNAGPRRVESAIRRTGSKDFWTHSKRRVLPRETRSYVPLILASIVIGKNPGKYGFKPSTTDPLEYEIVHIDSPVDLSTAAKSSGTSVEEMKLLNPELRRWVTPLDSNDYPLRVPKGKSEVFRMALAAIPENERVRFGTHTVRRGDTLSQIANRYGTTIEALSAANQIRRTSLIHPGQVLTVPVPPGKGFEYLRTNNERESVVAEGQKVYFVQRGDTLGNIAKSFRISLQELRALNGMSSGENLIHPRQKIVVSARMASNGANREVSPERGASGASTYIVQPGDTLSQIAKEQRVSLTTLRDLNGFSASRSRIYVGQTLHLNSSYDSGKGTTVYRVRRGDTLSKIARRFGVGIKQIRDWNNMSSDRIFVGERLTLYNQLGTN